MRCESAVELLPGIVDGSLRADRETVRHVESCLRCQAEMVQYRRLLRTLRALRTELLEPAPGLLADLLATLEEAGEQQAIKSLLHGRAAAYAGGLAAAATAGAVGAIILVQRARGRRLALAS